MKARRLELKDLGNGWEYRKIIGFIAGCPEQGQAMNYAEVTRRGDLVDEVEKAEGSILLDQAKYDLLVRLAKNFNWAMFTPTGVLAKAALDSIRTFMMELENSEAVELEAVKKES